MTVNMSATTMYLPTEGSKAAAEAVNDALVSGSRVQSINLESRSSGSQQTPNRSVKTTLNGNTQDSGYVSFLNSPEFDQLTSGRLKADGKPERFHRRLFPKKKLELFDRTLTHIEQTRSDDLRILFGRALPEYLRKKKLTFGAIEMRPAVMGEERSSARLFILAACQKELVKTLRRFFAQDEIKHELRPSNNVWPRFEVVVREQIKLFSGRGNMTVCVSNNSVRGGGPFANYGISICVRADGHAMSATLGGVVGTVRPGGDVEYYGLTAGHPFQRHLLKHDRGTGSPYGTSQDNMEDDSLPSTPTSNVDTVSSEVDSNSFHDSYMADDEDDYEINCWEIPAGIEDSPSNQNTPETFVSTVGEVVADSFTFSMPDSTSNCDWALIKLTPEFHHWAGGICSAGPRGDRPSLCNVSKADCLEGDGAREVSVPLEGKRHVGGLLSKRHSSILFGPGDDFADVYTLSGSGIRDLKEGVSGAWVYDTRTSEVYGHIIGKGLFGDALVMPMHAILTDIRLSMSFDQIWLQPRNEKVDELPVMDSSSAGLHHEGVVLRSLMPDTWKQERDSAYCSADSSFIQHSRQRDLPVPHAGEGTSMCGIDSAYCSMNTTPSYQNGYAMISCPEEILALMVPPIRRSPVVKNADLVTLLLSRRKPTHITASRPGRAPPDCRWVCTLCTDIFTIKEKSSDLRLHLRQAHDFAHTDVKDVFSTSNTHRLYEHFGPCTEAQAAANGWKTQGFAKKRAIAKSTRPVSFEMATGLQRTVNHDALRHTREKDEAESTLGKRSREAYEDQGSSSQRQRVDEVQSTFHFSVMPSLRPQQDLVERSERSQWFDDSGIYLSVYEPQVHRAATPLDFTLPNQSPVSYPEDKDPRSFWAESSLELEHSRISGKHYGLLEDLILKHTDMNEKPKDAFVQG